MLKKETHNCGEQNLNYNLKRYLDSINFDCKFKKGILENNCYEPLRVRGFFKKTDNSSKLLRYINIFFKSKTLEFNKNIYR